MSGLKRQKIEFTFDRVFAPSSSQAAVFEEISQLMETRSTELLSDWENNKPSPAQPAKMKDLRKGGVKCKARVRRSPQRYEDDPSFQWNGPPSEVDEEYRTQLDAGGSNGNARDPAGVSEPVTLPVYLNQTRADLLFTVDLQTASSRSGANHGFYEHGVALLAAEWTHIKYIPRVIQSHQVTVHTTKNQTRADLLFTVDLQTTGSRSGANHGFYEHGVTLPVYLNQTRADLLFTVDLQTASSRSSANHGFYEHGVALLAADEEKLASFPGRKRRALGCQQQGYREGGRPPDIRPQSGRRRRYRVVEINRGIKRHYHASSKGEIQATEPVRISKKSKQVNQVRNMTSEHLNQDLY
ncbi:Cytoplasmic dynein 1 heavy chain 1 [Branchiostoma belcheri]|nr:Cytoplasmic dynein 1 heavy chain 1 [Branchiostoma belcheri]